MIDVLFIALVALLKPMAYGIPDKTQPREEGFYEARLSPKVRDVVLEWLREANPRKPLPRAARRALETALFTARRMDLPSGEVIDWSAVRKRMEQAHCSEAEAIFDLSRPARRSGDAAGSV